jgi:hypothetical protein
VRSSPPIRVKPAGTSVRRSSLVSTAAPRGSIFHGAHQRHAQRRVPDLRVVATHQQDPAALAPLEITCFGGFEERRGDRPIRPCSNRNGRAILRFLVAQPWHRPSTDILMDAFWPEDAPEIARHKLHCALSALRRSLNDGYLDCKGGGYLLSRNEMYELNPSIVIRIDIARDALSGGDAAGRGGRVGIADHRGAPL